MVFSPVGDTLPLDTVGLLQETAATATLPPTATLLPTAATVAPATPTSLPVTPAATPTPEAGLPPGRDFTLTDLGNRQVLLSWQGGAATSLVLVRITPARETGITLPPSAASAKDTVPSDALVACWQLRGTSVANFSPFASDAVCLLPGIQSGFAATRPTIRLGQSNTASLSWDPAPGATSYLFLPAGTSRVQLLPRTAVSATDQTGGSPVCYILVALISTSASGVSNAVCGIPQRSFGLSVTRLENK